VRRTYLAAVLRPLPAAPLVASQVLTRGAQAASRGAVTLPQQKNSHSADFQRNGINITGFI
jgi:hypothetical protein